MREVLEARLGELERELAAGEERMARLDAERAQLNEVMLRISGAAQVLRELLDGAGSNGTVAAAASSHAEP